MKRSSLMSGSGGKGGRGNKSTNIMRQNMTKQKMKEQELTKLNPIMNPLNTTPNSLNETLNPLNTKVGIKVQSNDVVSEEILMEDEYEIVQDTVDLNDSGVQHVRLNGGIKPIGAFRGSLRHGENAYDLIICNDRIRMTSSYRMNTKILSGKKVWSPAHTKNLFPEHITEVDYFQFDKKLKGQWDIALPTFRCPRIKCCRIKCPKYQRRKLVTPAKIEPCRCEAPRCSLCSGLNPVTATIYIALLCYIFFLWFMAMNTGVITGKFAFMPAIQYMMYAIAALAFLLICEAITLRNLRQVEKNTVEDAERENEELADEENHIYEQHHDPKTGKDYYYNRESRLTLWTLPGDTEAEDGTKRKHWIKQQDPITGKEVYFNPNTNETVVERPVDFLSPRKSQRKKEEEEEEEILEKVPKKKDNGIEPGGIEMTRTARNLLSIKAIHENVENHHRACILTSCAFCWHLIFVFVIAIATLGKPYRWDGKRRLMMEERRLEQSGTCVPNLPAQHQGKLWCDEKYWNMEYGKEPKGEPYFSNCVPEPVKPKNCTRPKTKGYDYRGEDKSYCLSSDGNANKCAASLACDTDYRGSPLVALCTSDGPYSVSGCVDKCKRPSNIVGYYFGNKNLVENLTVATFSVTGLECAAGYKGTPQATVCQIDEVEYSLTGCKAECTRPKNNNAQTDLNGYNYAEEDSINCLFTDGNKDACSASLSCATNYVGTPSVTLCTTPGQHYTVVGCQSTCVRPVVNGYDFSNSIEKLDVATFQVNLQCANNWDTLPGQVPTATVCSGATLEYSVSGCEPKCKRPTTNVNGYNFTNENSSTCLRANSGDKLDCAQSLACAANYDTKSNIDVTLCTIPGAAYTVTGCDPICKRPSTIGYDYANEDSNNCLFKNGNSNTCKESLSCATGYVGLPDVTLCTSAGGKYSVSGCYNSCLRPPPQVTEGYNYTNVTETLTLSNFSVTGLKCASGWSGTVGTVLKCSGTTGTVTDRHYDLTGCTADCTTPTTTGYNYNSESSECLSTGGNANECANSLSCVTTGFVGSPAVTLCTSPGPYSVTGCYNTCLRPTDQNLIKNFDFSGVVSEKEVLDVSGFSVEGLKCANGWTGTPTVPSAEVCTGTSQKYNLVGCNVAVCTRPINMIGYNFTNESAAKCLRKDDNANECANSLSCDEGYYGTPSVTLCTSPGPYAVIGCTPPTTTAGPTTTPGPTSAPLPPKVTTPKPPANPEWWCPKIEEDDPDDPYDHLHRAKNKCGHCHARYMGPWVSVMIALVIEVIVMICIAILTSERKRLGRVTMGRYISRKKIPAVYEKGKYTAGKFKALEYKHHEFHRGRFRYIEPKVIHLARIVFTDRAKRKWTVFLQRKDAIKAQEHFYSIQSQNIRQKYQSHNDLTRR